MPGIDTYTKLLLHCDGADASTTFTDSSTAQAAKTVTPSGSAQIDTAQSKFGGASGLFDGTTDYLTVADDADWDFGTGDFTIDFWVRFAGFTDCDFVKRDSGSDIRFSHSQSSTDLRWVVGGSLIKSETWVASLNTWYHIALVRSGTNLMIFVDGTQLGSPTTNSSNISYTTDLVIAGWTSGSTSINGWLDEFRWSKGIARWTANFTPPTVAYSAPVGLFMMFD